MRQEEEGVYAGSDDDEAALDEAALEDMFQMTDAARDGLQYADALDAQAAAMREVRSQWYQRFP